MAAISVIINREVGLKSNVIDLLYLAQMLVVLLMVPGDKAIARKEISILGWTFIALATLTSLVGLYLFLIQWEGQVEFLSISYKIGILIFV